MNTIVNQAAQTKLVSNTVMLLEVFGLSGLILLGLYVFQIAQDESYFPIAQVTVSGDLQHANENQVLVAVRASIRGSFFSVKLEDVEKISAQNPWIESVKLRRIWPDHIRVYVTERRPVYRFGETALISQKAEVFTPFDMPQQVMGLPVIYADESRSESALSMMTDMEKILSAASLEVVEAYFDAKNIKVVLGSGIKIMAESDDVLKQLKELVSVYPVDLQVRQSKINTIDLRYDHGFAVAWK